MESLGELNETIFNLGGNLPEGDYLKMMNSTKKIFDAIKDLEQKNLLIQQQPHENVGIHRLMHIKTCINTDNIKYVAFINTDGATFLTARINDIIQILSNGENKKFIKITKINAHSIIYSLFRFIEDEGSFKVMHNIKLKKSDGYIQNDLFNDNVKKARLRDITFKNIYVFDKKSYADKNFNKFFNNFDYQGLELIEGEFREDIF